MENSSPNPSFSICDFRIQKQMSRSFGKSFPQKIVLPKLRPHCSATCPNTWRAEPRKKNTLSFFKRNFTPAKSRKQGVFFFRGCRGSARQWRNDTSVRFSFKPPRAPRVRLVGIRIISKIHSNFVQYTPPKFGIQISAKNMVGAKRRLFCIPPKKLLIRNDFPRSESLA